MEFFTLTFKLWNFYLIISRVIFIGGSHGVYQNGVKDDENIMYAEKKIQHLPNLEM